MRKDKKNGIVIVITIITFLNVGSQSKNLIKIFQIQENFLFKARVYSKNTLSNFFRRFYFSLF